MRKVDPAKLLSDQTPGPFPHRARDQWRRRQAGGARRRQPALDARRGIARRGAR